MRFALTTSILALALVPAAARAETANWDGFYAGAFAGYVDGKLLTDPGHASTTTILKDNGFMTGLVAGYRKQSDSNVVIGGELIVPLFLEKGRAVDHVFFPGQVFYEAKGKFAVMAGAHVGIATGKALPYVYGAVGIARVEGRTLNVNELDQLTPGFVQKATATPLVWQIGAGVDVQASPQFVVGARAGLFRVERADYNMPWNAGDVNKFGMSSFLGQVTLTYRFGG